MSYLKKFSILGEALIYSTRLHWFVLARPFRNLVVALLFFTQVFLDFFNIPREYYQYALIANFFIGGVFGLLFIIGLLGNLIKYISSEFGITNKRIISKFGFFSRASQEILIKKVEGITVSQSALGRIFNYGTVVISGTGGSVNVFPFIFNPMKFRKIAQEQLSSQDS